MYQQHPSSHKRVQDLNLDYWKIRHKARLCIALIYTVQFLHRLCRNFWDTTLTSKSKLIFFISLPFCAAIASLIFIEHLLFKERGRGIIKFSNLIDLTLLFLFMADWLIIIFSNSYRVQETRPPSFKVSALFGFTSFAWRTLLLTLIVQKWYLKMIVPIIAITVAAGYAIHYDSDNIEFLLPRALLQLFNVALIAYCENKLKWKMMWRNLQQEKWLQVNNFILSNMILDLKGEVRFISDYCE